MGDAGTAPETACMTPDQCFDEMAVALGVPKDTGYIDLLAMVKELKEEEEDAENQCDQDPTPEEARLLETMMKGFMGEITKLQEENKKQQERAERFRVLLCNRSEELVKALSPWKKEHQDHKRILEAIGELKEENEVNKKNLMKFMKENKELQSQLEDDTRQVHQLFAENEKLKEQKKDALGYINELIQENSKD